MSSPVPAIKVLLLPKDTNALGTIFGGVILSHIDLASAVEARKAAPHRYVTKAMNAVEFHAPVFVGDEMVGAYGISGGTSGQDEEMSDYARVKAGWSIRAATDTLPQEAKDQINAIYQQVGLKDRKI